MHNILTTDTIISFDIETTGLTVGVNSMIALGAVAYRNGEEISSFYGAMHELEGTERDAGTMQFWQQHLQEWKRIRAEAKEPHAVMTEFYDWGMSLKSPRVLAANPACFDSSFLWYYLHLFCGPNATTMLFKRHRAIDIRSYIMAIYGVPYSKAERMVCPEGWSEGLKITHNALEDAREQGVLFMNILKASVGEMELEEVSV